jgi:hypothetical protein
MGLDVGASVSSVVTNVNLGNTIPDIFAPEGIHVAVLYESNGNITVTANGGPVLSYKIPPLKGRVVLGFTGGTGGAVCTQEVDNFALYSICSEPAAEAVTIDGVTEADSGATVTLTANATGIDGTATYTWELTGGTATLAPNGATCDVTTAADFEGDVTVKVTVDDAVCAGSGSDEHTVNFKIPGGSQKPMDFNQDGGYDLSDPVALLNYLFLGGKAPPCANHSELDAANIALLDVNGSAAIDLSDAIYALSFLFLGGPRPVLCTDDFCPCVIIKDCPDNATCP